MNNGVLESLLMPATRHPQSILELLGHMGALRRPDRETLIHRESQVRSIACISDFRLSQNSDLNRVSAMGASVEAGFMVKILSGLQRNIFNYYVGLVALSSSISHLLKRIYGLENAVNE